jgi:DedD protein
MAENDVQLQVRKRARRRLVGAVAFVSVVAIVLPMVMDNEPRQMVQDVEIRIPGQDEKPFAPKFAVVVSESVPVIEPAASTENKPAVERPEPLPERPAERPAEKSADLTVQKPAEKAAVKIEKLPEKPVVKPVEKLLEKTTEKSSSQSDEAKRAAAILSGHAVDTKSPVKSGEYLILIGAFSNEANVRNLKSKLAEQDIKMFSEALNTPQGKKTRVRAGPFASREAAERALQKMQRIGVSGVVAAK